MDSCFTSVLYGPYWKHVLDGWSHRDDENVHFMFYEDAKLDLKLTLEKLAKFLGKTLAPGDLPGLMEYLKFENIKNNKAVNFKFNPEHGEQQQHVRRGKIGGNPEITEDISRELDEWTKNNIATGLTFPRNTQFVP